MKIAVIGSRTFSDYQKMKEFLDKKDISCIVSGGAGGADTLAEIYAKNKGIPTIIYNPDWNKYGKSAGFKRNELIIKTADEVVAFWDGKSKGTKHSIDLANMQNKNVEIVRF